MKIPLTELGKLKEGCSFKKLLGQSWTQWVSDDDWTTLSLDASNGIVHPVYKILLHNNHCSVFSC